MHGIQIQENILEKHEKILKIKSNEELECTYVMNSIVCHGDAVGLVIILSERKKITEVEEKIAQIAAQFLSKYLEE